MIFLEILIIAVQWTVVARAQARPSVPFVSTCTYSATSVSGCPTFSLTSLPHANYTTTPCYVGAFSHYRQYKFHLFSHEPFALQFDVKFHHTPQVVMRASLEQVPSQWNEFVVAVDETLGLKTMLNNNTIDSVTCFSKASEMACSSFNENKGVFKMEMYVYGKEIWWTPYCEPTETPQSQSHLQCNLMSIGIIISLCISLIISVALFGLVLYLTVDCRVLRRWFFKKKSNCELTLRPTILRPNTRVAFYANEIT